MSAGRFARFAAYFSVRLPGLRSLLTFHFQRLSIVVCFFFCRSRKCWRKSYWTSSATSTTLRSGPEADEWTIRPSCEPIRGSAGYEEVFQSTRWTLAISPVANRVALGRNRKRKSNENYDATLPSTTEGAAAVLAQLKSVIGPHAIHLIQLEDLTVLKHLADFVPAIHYARSVLIFTDEYRNAEQYTEDVELFRRPEELYLCPIPTRSLASFLCSSNAAQLRELRVTAPDTERGDSLDAAAEEAIIRFCFDVNNLGVDERMRVEIQGWNLKWAFILRLIEVFSSRTGSSGLSGSRASACLALMWFQEVHTLKCLLPPGVPGIILIH